MWKKTVPAARTDLIRTSRAPLTIQLAWVLGVFSFLLLWQLGADMVGSALILPGPGEAFLSLAGMVLDQQFWLAMIGSLGRTLVAFGLTLLISLPLGILMGQSAHGRAFFGPYIAILRSTPVISVIVLGLIWFKSGDSPVWVCLLMTIPILVQAISEGVQARDRQILEMAKVFSLGPWTRMYRVVLPGLLPHFRAGGRSALGIGWKVVAAAEVLSMPRYGLGTMLQDARSNLETGQVLALTTALILVAGLGDFLLALFLRLPHEKSSSPAPVSPRGENQ